jgi:flagellar biosynthesis/type III secretory pathway chaperone
MFQQLNQCQAKILTSQNEIDHMKPKLTEKSQLKSELERLTKELLIMGEINQHQKDVIEKASLNKGKIPEACLQFHSCQKELTG